MSGACGIDVTVSVSTVMLCNEASPVLFFVIPCLIHVLDCLVVRGGALTAPLRRPTLALSVSLPLSFAPVLPAASLESPRAMKSVCDISEIKLSSSFSPIDSPGPRGDPIGLASCTVSRVDVLPPPPRAGVRIPAATWASSASVSDGSSAGIGIGGVARWILIRGASCSGLLGSPIFGLWSMGGGDRNLGDTGHLGDSRRCSIVVGDLTGAPASGVELDADGRSVGVLADDSVLEPGAGAGAGLACLADDRVGLMSWWLFFLERIPEFADEAREEAVRESGLVGEGSRDARGDGAADDEVDVAEVCEANLEGPDSVIGVIVAVLAEDSREYVGCAFWLPGPSDDPAGMFGDLSMSACEHWHWLGREEGRLALGHTCHA
jgi:hypothetical protein